MQSLGSKFDGGYWAVWNAGNTLMMGEKWLEKIFI